MSLCTVSWMYFHTLHPWTLRGFGCSASPCLIAISGFCGLHMPFILSARLFSDLLLIRFLPNCSLSTGSSNLLLAIARLTASKCLTNFLPIAYAVYALKMSSIFKLLYLVGCPISSAGLLRGS